MNKVILLGRLTKNPEVRYTQSNKAVANFTLAVNRRMGRNAQDGQPTADFIPCIVWEKLAEVCANNLVKGSQIMVEGRMQVRSYDAQDGSKRYVTEVVVNEMEFVGSRPQGAGAPQGMDRGFPPAPAPMQGAHDSFGTPGAISDEEIPF